MSRSYTNLLNLASGNFPVMGREKKQLPRVMTVPGVISELDDDQVNSVSSDVPSLVNWERDQYHFLILFLFHFCANFCFGRRET